MISWGFCRLAFLVSRVIFSQSHPMNIHHGLLQKKKMAQLSYQNHIYYIGGWWNVFCFYYTRRIFWGNIIRKIVYRRIFNLPERKLHNASKENYSYKVMFQTLWYNNKISIQYSWFGFQWVDISHSSMCEFTYGTLQTILDNVISFVVDVLSP